MFKNIYKHILCKWKLKARDYPISCSYINFYNEKCKYFIYVSAKSLVYS